MRRRIVLLLTVVAVLGLIGGIRVASAHECKDNNPDDPRKCQDSKMVPNWRGNYIPLFEPEGIRCETEECQEKRRQEQRWRDEWGCDAQWCIWVKVQSDVEGDKPQSVHAGTAADHSMTEVAHESEGHQPVTPYTAEGNHDTHGGSIYADICLGSDDNTSYQDQPGACSDPDDTQVGMNIVDHFPCGRIAPVYSCTDEYHVVRPLDPTYTQNQMTASVAEIQGIASDPDTWVCGYATSPQGPECRNTVPNPPSGGYGPYTTLKEMARP